MNSANILLITQLAIQASTQVQQFLALMAKANSEGRDVTDAELDTAAASYDSAKAALLADIARARSGGR